MVLDRVAGRSRETSDSPKYADITDPELLIEYFPKSLGEHWREKIAGKPLEEQLTLLRQGLEGREKSLRPKSYVSERLQIMETVPETLLHAMRRIEENAVEFNRGLNGRLIRCKTPSDPRRSVAYKLLLRPPIPPQNELVAEASYLADMHAFAAGNPDLRIGVPKPFFFVSRIGVEALAQQEITDAYSVEDIGLKKIHIPENLDIDAVFDALAEFVRRMNAAGYYHRDLREGNVMINLQSFDDPSQPLAYIVDMGYCTSAPSEESAYRNLDAPIDRVILSQVKKKLEYYRDLQKQEGV